MHVLTGFLAGERRALSRAISLAERDDATFAELFDALFDRVAEVPRIGVTGPPGVGKSTLLAGLVHAWRAADETVGVLAVDPSSPFTGGALLGDRVRMGAHTLDTGTFIRSMATRGALGGLARRAVECCDLYAAFGFDRVLVETVGVGQIEFDVIEASDVVVVVLQPGGGDSVQAFKAGLYELADVLVINKADQPGVERLRVDLEEAMALRAGSATVPIVRTVASTGDGVDDVVASVGTVLDTLAASGRLAERRASRRRAQLRQIVSERLGQRLWGAGGLAERSRVLTESAAAGPPYATAERLLHELLDQA